MKIQSIEVLTYRPLVLTKEKGWIAGQETSVFWRAKAILQDLSIEAQENGFTVIKAITKLVPAEPFK